jgi:hypothetical protein
MPMMMVEARILSSCNESMNQVWIDLSFLESANLSALAAAKWIPSLSTRVRETESGSK